MKLTSATGGADALTGDRRPGAGQRRARRARRRGLLLVEQLDSPPASSGSSSAAPTAVGSSSAAASAQKVKLTFWSWVPNMDKVVAIWNKAHPDIQVRCRSRRAATRSHQAAHRRQGRQPAGPRPGRVPGAADARLQQLPGRHLASTTAAKSDFPAGIWNQVTLGTRRGLRDPAGRRADGAVLPRRPVHQVRPDRADHLGAVRRGRREAARQKRPACTWARSPASTRASSPAWPSRRARSGGPPPAPPGRSASTTPPPRRSPTSGALVAAGGVDNQPQWTAAWNKGMNDGKYIAWVSDVWAPGDLPTAAPSGAGKWAMTALPQWTAGAARRGNWGGSSTAVMAASKHQQAAAEFATWLNTDPAATAALVPRRHLPGRHRRGGRAGHAAGVLLQPARLLLARQAVRGRGRGGHLGPGRERRLQRVHRRVRQRRHQQGVVPQPRSTRCSRPW